LTLAEWDAYNFKPFRDFDLHFTRHSISATKIAESLELAECCDQRAVGSGEGHYSQGRKA
jgi:hypothetical protein